MMYSPLFFASVALAYITEAQNKTLSINNKENNAGKKNWEDYQKRWGPADGANAVKERAVLPTLGKKQPAPAPKPSPAPKPEPTMATTAAPKPIATTYDGAISEKELGDEINSIKDYLSDEVDVNAFFQDIRPATNMKYQRDPEMQKRYKNAEDNAAKLGARYDFWKHYKKGKYSAALMNALKREYKDFFVSQK